MANHAVVFGAAGLLGWSVINELLSDESSFSQVTAVVNRPVSEEQLCLPKSANRPSLQIVSGINLLAGSGTDLANALRDANVTGITHAFYFVFQSHGEDHVQECSMNCAMMRRVADALNMVAPDLKSVVYSGGTRGYGIYVPGGTFTPPLHEGLADNLPPDYAQTVAYPWFRAILTAASTGWTWTEICPDAVVGFSPNGSGYSLALHWGQYLSLYRAVEGEGAQVPFPGCEAAARSKFSPVSGRTLARVAIFAALQPACAGKVINVADRDAPCTYGELWPAIAAWFSLRGEHVRDASQGAEALRPGEYIAKHRRVFADHAPKAVTCGVGAGSEQLDSVGWWLTFDRQLSLRRLREVGFHEEREPVDGWLEAFERLQKAGIIL